MMNHSQQRRMFRGRGGPNDRRLPKHNARRRKTTISRGTNEEHVVESSDDDHDQEEDASSRGSNEQQTANEVVARIVDDFQNGHAALAPNSTPLEEPQSQLPESSTLSDTTLQKEINHLLQRIQNIQKSMQLSKAGNTNPATYRTNVLGATQNCVKEWKSIRRYYYFNYNGDSSNHTTTAATAAAATDHEDADDICKTVSLSIFSLIQHALQCGPLQGAKPGYFKRCGSEVAAAVYQCLENISRDRETSVRVLCFTEKQADAIEKWKTAANKAAQSDDDKCVAPSVSVRKKQQQQRKGR